MIAPITGKQATAGKKPWPSYIPSRTFVTALLDVAAAHSDKAAPGDGSSPPAPEDGSPPHASAVDAEVAAAIAALPSAELRRALLVLYRMRRATPSGSVGVPSSGSTIRCSASRAGTAGMCQVALWVIGIVVVILLNVDTLQVADTLWKDPAARSAVVAQADAAAKQGQGADASSALSKLELPLGWKLFKAGSGPQEFPNRAGGIIAKIVGLLLTVAALSLGAPFWYDLLGKFVRVSGTGPRPPTADQRRGQRRRRGSRPHALGLRRVRHRRDRPWPRRARSSRADADARARVRDRPRGDAELRASLGCAYWDEEERVADAIAKLRRLRDGGIETIVDPTVSGWGGSFRASSGSTPRST